ncbi:DNA/RNA non-specific endonuclease [Enterovibrio paralichthyis]|uniref:DNA/RNA non-specific endonuclease n=1 Tax=Enterovibrio paralichthyis TaxID=2853805 RepID=UPI001C47DE84|nr:DNA/RNA non-specific endonuclease [Enterovibrio paralichthyis]MBV7300224.1 DNA/RNA non-specific endonuclease [Enterovibrio paralichthyis]
MIYRYVLGGVSLAGVVGAAGFFGWQSLELDFLKFKSAPKPVIIQRYAQHSLWIDCEKRIAIMFAALVGADHGNAPREDEFTLDPSVDKRCQQRSTLSYGTPYDRGHLFAANHADSDPVAIHQSNYMTNIMPQHRNLNRGAMKRTEFITECLRDMGDVWIVGGIFKNETPIDSLILHGIEVPAHIWKVIHSPSLNKTWAYIFPNDSRATWGDADTYLTSLDEIDKRWGGAIQYPFYIKSRSEVMKESYPVTKSCNIS